VAVEDEGVDEARAALVGGPRNCTRERLHAGAVRDRDDLIVLNVRADLDGELGEPVAVGLEVHGPGRYG
jgi:hypothetical protein